MDMNCSGDRASNDQFDPFEDNPRQSMINLQNRKVDEYLRNLIIRFQIAERLNFEIKQHPRSGIRKRKTVSEI